MDEQPPILFGVPFFFKKRKAEDLIDGIPVLESTPATPPDIESQTASPESPPVPPPELAEPLTLKKIPAPDPEFLVKETAMEAAPASLPSLDSPRGPPPSPTSTNGPALEELLGTQATSPLVEASVRLASFASSHKEEEEEDSVFATQPPREIIIVSSRETSPDEVSSSQRSSVVHC